MKLTITGRLLFFSLSVLLSSFSYSQIELAHLSRKGFSAIGYSAYLSAAMSVSEGSSIVTQVAAYSF